MLRVMIADDEYLVIESLKHIIENYVEDVEVICTASSGREAVEQALKWTPDLVFMDIKMPGITGIEAIRSIRAINRHSQFVIISAYEQFNFAKEGIELGVLDYLTKPFMREQIIQLIEKAKETLQEKHQALNREIVLKEKLGKIMPYIENQLIYTYLYHGVSFESLEFYEELFGFDLSYGYMISLLMKDPVGHSIQDSMAYSLEKQQFMSKIVYEVKSVLPCLSGPPLMDRLVFFVPVKAEANPYDVRNKALEAIDKMLLNVDLRNTIQFQIGIGRIHPITEMYLSYKESMAATKILEEARVVHIDDVTLEADHKISYNVLLKEQLINAYLKGDGGDLSALLDELFMELFSQTNQLTTVKAKLLELVITLKKSDPNKDFGSKAEDEAFMHHFLGVEDRTGLKQLVQEYLAQEIVETAKRKENSYTNVIAKAMAYIDEHYGQNISLNDVAEHINMSYFYFSRLFKESTGKSFSDYLTEYRIERSIELMQDDALSIKEISYQIGYNDPNYFSKIFKKIVGITPTDYRMRMSKHED